MPTEYLLYILFALVAGFALGWVFKRPAIPDNSAKDQQLQQLTTQLALTEKEINYLEREKSQIQDELSGKSKELAATLTQLHQTENETHSLKTQISFKDQQLSTQTKQLSEIGLQFTKEFQILAQQILEEKTNTFNKHQEKSLADILNPLKENIHHFKTEFESKYKTESDERISLREQIKYMMELNNTLSTQANNLTNALRGQVKQQGNWGEMILESILEHADLQKDIHYFVQSKTEGEEGQTLLPDIIVRYPDSRSIVIDSKVSLLNYEQYSSATTSAEQELALKSLLLSVTRHIDGLSGKKYQDAVGALDFVMLFIPVEGAYITIMQSDRSLWQYAYRKKVLLISPTNLIAAMKLVYDLWKREGINQNAKEIGERASRIYDKLAAFVEEFDKIGNQLTKATASYTDARKKLTDGNGNLISLAKQIKDKAHHSKPKRELPPDLLEQARSAEQTENEDSED
ncbi:MAG: DNA recombination protein RmuC [Gemmatimonadaceae bacterium]|nr:DNA recombination protein RmuC [Chitinophagaceae bacterium]